MPTFSTFLLRSSKLVMIITYYESFHVSILRLIWRKCYFSTIVYNVFFLHSLCALLCDYIFGQSLFLSYPICRVKRNKLNEWYRGCNWYIVFSRKATLELTFLGAVAPLGLAMSPSQSVHISKIWAIIYSL